MNAGNNIDPRYSAIGEQKMLARQYSGQASEPASPASMPEVPALLEHLSRELGEAESCFAQLLSRLEAVTRPVEPQPTGLTDHPPKLVPNSNMGNLIHDLSDRVASLTREIRSQTRRLEV